MSAANFFSVLSDSTAPAVGSNAVHLEHPPMTANSTSSKKSDSNPRADPSKARPRNQGPPSNDRVLRDSKNAGRSNNRDVPVRQGADSHHSRRHERTDRQSRTGKRDTAKRTRSGWGAEEDEPVDEVLGEEDAQRAERAEQAGGAEPAGEQAPAAPKITFEEYMQTQREQAEALNTRKPKTAPAPAAAPATPASEVPETRKKNTSKPAKEVQTLPLDASAAPSLLPRPNGRPERRDRGAERRPARGDKPTKRGDKKGGKPPARGEKPAKRGEKKGGKGLDLGSLPTL